MREETSSAPVASSESALANQTTPIQLLSSHLKDADPAMYEIIENASTSIDSHEMRGRGGECSVSSC